MAHAVAVCFEIKDRGYIREGYKADLVLVNPNETTAVQKKGYATSVVGHRLTERSSLIELTPHL